MAAVEAVGGNHVLHLQDPKSGSVTVSRAFDAQSGKLALEFKLMNKLSDTNFFRMILHDGAPISGKEKFLTEFYLLSSGELVYRTASAPNANVSVATLNNDIWYTIRCEADFGTKTYEIFVNGESKAADIPFRNELTSVDHVIFATGGNSYKADVLLDDIKLLSLGAASAKAASEPLDTPQTPAAPAPETPSVPEAPSGNESASTPPDASEPDGAAGEPGVIPPAAKDEASASDTAPENEQ